MARENTISDLQHLNGLLFSLEKNLKKNTVFLHFGPLFFYWVFHTQKNFPDTSYFLYMCTNPEILERGKSPHGQIYYDV